VTSTIPSKPRIEVGPSSVQTTRWLPGSSGTITSIRKKITVPAGSTGRKVVIEPLGRTMLARYGTCPQFSRRVMLWVPKTIV
jgi:hypothetical protein